MPVTIYTDFDVSGTPFLPLLRSLMRPGDALVVSYLDAFKGDFRVAQLELPAGAVWVHVKSAGFAQARARNLAGVGGIFVFPLDRRGGIVDRAAIESAADEARSIGVPLMAGIGSRSAFTLSNVGDLARAAPMFSFYASEEQARSRDVFTARVGRVIRDAKENNPTVKIEIAVASCATREASLATVEALRTVGPLIARIGIYCNDTKPSSESLALLLNELRNPE